jgi:Asp-tRNA(Asn)/Glu-tRNA(Gln) amidotransferase C subunit
VEERTEISKETVTGLADTAELPLTEARVELLAPQLNELVIAANELNRKMARHWELPPTIQFTHAPEGKEVD